MGLLVQTERMVQRDRKAPLEQPDHKVLPVLQEQQDLRDLQVLMVPQVRLVHRVPVVLLVRKVRLVLRALQEPMEQAWR
jgi:hypothetical protein